MKLLSTNIEHTRDWKVHRFTIFRESSFFSVLHQRRTQLRFVKIDLDDLEYLFMSGITATVGLNVEDEEITALYKRFSRVNLSLCNRTSLYPVDLNEPVPESRMRYEYIAERCFSMSIFRVGDEVRQ